MMKNIDWRKHLPQVILWGVIAAAAGVATASLATGKCPFSVCAGVLAGQGAAAGERGSAEDGSAKKEEMKMEWLTDYNEARKLAAEENKILFLSFSGSDWCGWCIKLDREVLETPEFRGWAAKNAILVKIDFPTGIPQSAAQKSHNEALARYYGVEGFPTVVLAGTDGREIARTGYRDGGAAAYVKHLEQIRKQVRP